MRPRPGPEALKPSPQRRSAFRSSTRSSPPGSDRCRESRGREGYIIRRPRRHGDHDDPHRHGELRPAYIKPTSSSRPSPTLFMPHEALSRILHTRITTRLEPRSTQTHRRRDSAPLPLLQILQVRHRPPDTRTQLDSLCAKAIWNTPEEKKRFRSDPARCPL